MKAARSLINLNTIINLNTMIRKNTLLFWLLICAMTVTAQQNLKIVPEKPKPGDKIEITYTPAGDIANTLGKVEAVVFKSGSQGRKADDLELKKSGKKYTASIQTDTSHNFVQLGFYVDKKFDTNFGEGYYVHLYDGQNPRIGSYSSLGYFHQYYGSATGIESDNVKALAALEKEFTLYPEQKRKLGMGYFRLLNSQDKDKAKGFLDHQIETVLAAGLRTEDDYTYLESLYNAGKMMDKVASLTAEKKEKFPEGKWLIREYVDKFFKEADAATKAEMLSAIRKNVETNEDWKSYEGMMDRFRMSLMSTYAKDKDWDSYKKLGEKLSKKSLIAQSYNGVAWGLQEKNEDLNMAKDLASAACEITRSEWKNPTETRPDYATAKDWEMQRKFSYGMQADTYAMVLYRLGEYKKGFDLTKEAAITIYEGKNIDQNNTYALLAEKVLPPSALKTELERFVRDGQANSTMKEMLKRVYVAEKSSEDGFADYITALEKEAYLKMVDELRKSMINDESPAFAVVDLGGKKVSSADLRGKIVVIDFWATWCGPCKASFPAMQKMVEKYRESDDVKFVFIDTWERVENKEKNASDFIESNKYSFHVLMDNDNKVVEQFKVEGIPTKFVLDKDGRIRFKSVGFGGSDDKLMSELTAMIEMAKGEKSF